MTGIEKDYYTLEEIMERWSMALRDLRYLAENDLLKLSVRLYGIHLEMGQLEELEDGTWAHLPEGFIRFNGIQDLLPFSVHRIFRERQAEVGQFAAPQWRYCRIGGSESPILVRQEDLVIRRQERDRFDAEHGLGDGHQGRGTVVVLSEDYSVISVANRTFEFGPIQARVIRILHDATLNGAPWRNGKHVLLEAKSSSARVADLFKSQPEWRQLIKSDGRGKYRLNPDLF